MSYLGQAYTEDLLDCLNAKAPEIEDLEALMCETLQLLFDKRWGPSLRKWPLDVLFTPVDQPNM